MWPDSVVAVWAIVLYRCLGLSLIGQMSVHMQNMDT